MQNRPEIEALLEKYGFTDYRWIPGSGVLVANWVRVKCMFGCDSYGKRSACPPNVPSVAECRAFFSEYENAVLIRIEKKLEEGEDLGAWCKEINGKLTKMEREVFLSGCHKAFVLFIDECNLCRDCADERADCRSKKTARPCTEAMAVDVYGTARAFGYPIAVLPETGRTMNRYAILLAD